MRPGRARHANFYGLVDEITTATRFGNDAELHRVVRAAAENIPTVRDLVDNVLAPAANAIVELWEGAYIDRGAADAALFLLGRALPEGSRVRPHRARQRIAVGFVCPVGEWHDLSARMVAAILRDETDGMITTLGASVANDAILSYIAENRPLAIVMSCTDAANLPRAADTVSAVHATGTPIIAIGQAFADREHRARAIGGDVWCASAGELVARLHAWERNPPSVTRRFVPATGDALTEDDRARIVDSAMRVLTRPDVTSGAHPVLTERTASRLHGMVKLLEASVLVDDESVLIDGINRWRRRMRASQVPTDAFLEAAFDAVTPALESVPFRSLLLRARSATLTSCADEQTADEQEIDRFTSYGR